MPDDVSALGGDVRRYLPKSITPLEARPQPGPQKQKPALDPANIPGLLASLAGTSIFAGHRDSGELVNLHSGDVIPTIASLTLPAGSFAIFAKLNLTRSDTTASVIGNEVTCFLAAGNDSETANIMVEGWGYDVTVAPSTSYVEGATELGMSLMITHRSSVGRDVILACCAGPAEAEPMVGKVAYNDLRLIAIGADRIFDQEL